VENQEIEQNFTSRIGILIVGVGAKPRYARSNLLGRRQAVHKPTFHNQKG